MKETVSTESWIRDYLDPRAGASDTNTEAWLAERRKGVTATQVAALYRGRITPDALAMNKFIEECKVKQGTVDDTPPTSNIWIEWGKAREPEIAATVKRMIPSLEHESRVFKSSVNDRYLASPDMIGALGSQCSRALAEIKTSSKFVFPGTKHFQDSGYLEQMQWQMFVLDAEQCLFVLEQHEEFRPKPLALRVIDRDEKLITQLRKLADATLACLDDIVAKEEVNPS